MNMKLHLFVGPTASDIEHILGELADVVVHSPVKRGDIKTLITEQATPAVIAIVDGTFHSFPSVGHSEIRHAIQAGWKIWGLASMGAIRASEMKHLGMYGYGVVYGHYANDPEFDDDEVTLVHEIEPPFRALSEPMIHIRGFIDALLRMKKISKVSADAIINSLKERWYAERTLQSLRKLLIETGEMPPVEIDDALRDFKAFRIKNQDLKSFLASGCWRVTSGIQ
jgi:hypothetical protein